MVGTSRAIRLLLYDTTTRLSYYPRMLSPRPVIEIDVQLCVCP